MKQKILFFIFSLIFSASCIAKTHTVGQKDQKFTIPMLKVKVGDTVKFLNEDSFFHNVFSLSDVKFFDLGSFPLGEFKEVTFDQVGTVDIECAIHPEMIMKIIVE